MKLLTRPHLHAKGVEGRGVELVVLWGSAVLSCLPLPPEKSFIAGSSTGVETQDANGV